MPHTLQQDADAQMDDGARRDVPKRCRVQYGSWDPPWLKKTVLLAFMALFLFLAASLLLVYHFVLHLNGLPMTLMKTHYAWTYGPTFFLVMVVALWRRVQYCIMLNQPWQDLSCNSPQPAEKAVLLDYLSPLQITTFVTALRNRHFAVATSVSIFAILKAIIVISTTLFLPSDTPFHQDVQINRLTQFKYEDPFQANAERPKDPVVWSYWGLRGQYPDATSIPIARSQAFTDFSIASPIPSGLATVTSAVEILEPQLTCERATVDFHQAETHFWSTHYELRLRSRSCATNFITRAFCVHNEQGVHHCEDFFLSRVNCTNDTHPNLITLDTYRYVFIMVNFDAQASWHEETNLHNRTTISGPPANAIASSVRTAAISCRSGYALRQAEARSPSLNSKNVQSLQITDDKERKLPRFTDIKFSETVRAILGASDPIFSKNLRVHPSQDNGDVVCPGSYAFLGLIKMSDISKDSLLDIDVLQNAVKEVWTGLSHEMMRHYFLAPDNSTSSSGFIQYTEKRLHIRKTALWAIVGLCLLSSCLVGVGIIPFCSKRVTPCSPATLNSRASSLLRSPAIHNLLDHSGTLTLCTIKDVMCKFRFFTTKSCIGTPIIHTIEKSDQVGLTMKSMLAPDTRNPWRPWMPYSSRRYGIALTLIPPVIVIATLEVLKQCVFINDSTLTIPSSDFEPGAYAIRYGSTLIMVLIATSFTSLDFSIATFTPFSRLAKGHAPAEATMHFNIIENLPPIALHKTLRYKYFGTASSLIASTIGSMLTIIVSGLWYLDVSATFSGTASSHIQSGWAVDFGARTTPGTEAARRSWRGDNHGIAGYEPTLIWAESLVFPKLHDLEMSQAQAQRSRTSQNYTFTIPAVQPNLECSVLPEVPISFEEFSYNTTESQFKFWFGANFSPATGCIPEGGPAYGNKRTVQYSGPLYDLETVYPVSYSIDLVPSVSMSSVSGTCPSLGVIVGGYQITANSTGGLSLHHNVTALACSKTLNSINTTVVFSNDNSPPSPTNTLNHFRSPGLPMDVIVHPATAAKLVDPQTGRSSLAYNIGHAFRVKDNDFIPFLIPYETLTSNFVGQAIESYPGKRILELTTNTDLLVEELNRFYRRFMTRIIDEDYRMTLDPSSPLHLHQYNSSYSILPITVGEKDGLIYGTATSMGPQLKINETSKIILEVMLAAMVIMASLAYWLVDMRGVLPRNPFSIASGMAFFAGSRLVSENEEFGDDDTQSSSSRSHDCTSLCTAEPPCGCGIVTTDGRLFRLGWWDENGEPVDSDDVRDGDKISNEEETSTSEGDTGAPRRRQRRRRYGIDIHEPETKSCEV